MRADGFTLIEILVVIAILAIVALAAFMNFSGVDQEKKLAAAATEVADAFRVARSKTVQSGTVYRVDVNPAAETVEVVNSATGKIDYHPGSKQPYRLDFASSGLLSGVDIDKINDSSSLVSVQFTAKGQATADVTVLLAAGGRTMTVTVNRGNGRVAVSGP